MEPTKKRVTTEPARSAGKAVTDKPFTIYDVQSCLYDTRRVEYLWDAIRRTVRDGDIAVDAGSGTGLLGMLAAKSGARRVYCLELNPEFIEVIAENARRNGLADRIVPVHADAANCDLPEEVDVLVSEVISGGFFYEPQLQIVNNLRRFLRPDGSVIPMAMRNYVELIDAQEVLYGLTFSFDSRFTELDGDRSLTTAARYLTTDFSERSDPIISARVGVRATETATANAIRISYDIDFAPGVSADKPTVFLLNPQIVFLPEPVQVRRGDEYLISLGYEAGGSPLDAKVDITAA